MEQTPAALRPAQQNQDPVPIPKPNDDEEQADGQAAGAGLAGVAGLPGERSDHRAL